MLYEALAQLRIVVETHDRTREVGRIAGFEELNGAFPEIVFDRAQPRGDDWNTKGRVVEQLDWQHQMRRAARPIRNNADICRDE